MRRSAVLGDGLSWCLCAWDGRWTPVVCSPRLRGDGGGQGRGGATPDVAGEHEGAMVGFLRAGEAGAVRGAPEVQYGQFQKNTRLYVFLVYFHSFGAVSPSVLGLDIGVAVREGSGGGRGLSKHWYCSDKRL